jgi:2-polyprenyl-3-methyl-5-hydroxy-6-metoxy-1,4-benzoquinol methylase
MADTISPYMGRTALEIGAGMGNIARHLCARRKLYIATDLEAEHVEYLRMMFRHRPLVRVARLDATLDADFEPFRDSVETVVCMNVLEHIEDDAAALVRIRTLIQESGRLILLVPNDPRAFGAIDTAVGHYRRYTPETLAAVLAATGYELEKMLRFNRISMPAWRFTGQVRKTANLSRTALRIFDRFVWLWRKIDSSLPWEPTSIIAIARRKE